MRVLILNADYSRFLTWLYGRHPGLASASYADQMNTRNASLFGVNDFYPFNRAELKETEPEIYALLAEIWDMPSARKAK